MSWRVVASAIAFSSILGSENVQRMMPTPRNDAVMLIVQESLRRRVPAELALELAWEESRWRPDALRLEPGDRGCDGGLFQVNHATCELPESAEQVREGMAIVAKWWVRTEMDWRETVWAYRHGHLREGFTR